jgi:hypothetical protein
LEEKVHVGQEEEFSITPFSHQASLYRGTDRDVQLGDEYDSLLEANIEKTKSDLRLVPSHA